MGESSGVSKKPTITPLQYLDELCVYMMSIGMSYHDYWYGDPQMIKYYAKAEEKRLQKVNQEKYLQGLYVYQAIGSLVPVLNPFSKDHKAKPYLKQPIPITEEEMEAQENARVQEVYDYLQSKVKEAEVIEK